MKNFIAIAITVVTLAACQSKETEHQVPVSHNAANETLVKQYFDHFNGHDWEKMAAMYTDSAEFKDPSLGQGIVKQSHQDIIKKYGELQQMIPDVRDSVIATYPSGDNHIVVEFISKGTAPDKTTFELPICTVFNIEHGKISKYFTYYDNFNE